MSGGVEYFDHVTAEVDDIAVMQYPCRRSLKELVGADVVVLWQVAAVHDHPTDGLYVEGKPAREPVKLICVCVEVRIVPMSAYMVPVDVRGDGRHRLVRESVHLHRDIADAESRVDQQGPLVALEQVAVCLLPVATLADGVGVLINRLHREPGSHRQFLPCSVSCMSCGCSFRPWLTPWVGCRPL